MKNRTYFLFGNAFGFFFYLKESLWVHSPEERLQSDGFCVMICYGTKKSRLLLYGIGRGDG